jgi:hypothetical protein
MSLDMRVSRRTVLTIAGAAGAGAAGLVAAEGEDEQTGRKLTSDELKEILEHSKESRSCRLLARMVDGTKAKAQVIPGIVNNTFFLVVAGKKPFLNMSVTLSPLVYVRQPDYWEIEVVGCTSGIVLPVVGAYAETLSLDSYRGKKGIEVVWADGRQRIDI